MSAYHQVKIELIDAPKKWLVTGAAGFIGSNLLEELLKLGQTVVGLDNFSTGKVKNLDEVKAAVPESNWKKFRLIEGDITNGDVCKAACQEVDYVLHQAALGSVPASIKNPANCHNANVTGFLQMLVAARDAKVQRFVFASSSAVYGDEPTLPKKENRIGRPLSPYSASKRMDEIYAEVFARAYDFPSIGLRYFNVFGPRQDPEGPYAAVIAKWLPSLLRGEAIQINGDGTTSRDFCFVANVVQANILAATSQNLAALNQIYNISVGARTSLNELLILLRKILKKRNPLLVEKSPIYAEFRPGDIRDSHANIDQAVQLLGYHPTHNVDEGLEIALNWYQAALPTFSQISHATPSE